MTVFLISICIPPIIHLVCPPNLSITFVFNFPWVFQWSQEKLKTMLKHLFFWVGGGGGDEGVGVWGVKVYYGRYANGKLIKYLYLLWTSSPVLFPQKMEGGGSYFLRNYPWGRIWFTIIRLNVFFFQFEEREWFYELIFSGAPSDYVLLPRITDLRDMTSCWWMKTEGRLDWQWVFSLYNFDNVSLLSFFFGGNGSYLLHVSNDSR